MTASPPSSIAPMAETLIPNCTRGIPSNLSRLRPTSTSRGQLASSVAPKSAFVFPIGSVRTRKWGARAAATSPSAVEDSAIGDKVSMSTDNLRRFIELNVGKWNGSFYQFDAHGNLLQSVSTKLSASSYGEDELISLIQTLYVKQPPSFDDEPEWVEYKIKETNMFTVDKYQQIGFFPRERAFSLRYQTAGMLETVLRAGVLGEDDIGEEHPKSLKIPSKWPSVVCENCLYSLKKEARARAFHVMDPKGVLEMLLLFVEDKRNEMPAAASCNLESSDLPDRITPWLGRWEGHSVTKRSGVYGATVAEADTVALLEMDDKGNLIQEMTSTATGSETTTTVQWTGTINDNLITFEGGFQLTLLPGGMYMGCPSDIGKNVSQSQSFHLEFCWMESPEKRQRLVRTYDVEGLAVSSTYFCEIKV